MTRPPVLIITFLFTITVLGQTVPKDSITYLEEVVIYNEAVESTALGITPSITIREKAFQNFSPIDIASSINQVSGLYVLSGALNTNRITIRGVGARTPFGTDKLRLYYNEIPVTNGTGFSTIEAFDLENMASVEVVKGPKGTAFGSNLGGAILLSTKDPVSETSGLRNNSTVGSFGLFKNNLQFTHQDSTMALNLHYDHLQTDGYRENNSFDRDGLLLNTSLKLNDISSLSLLVNYIDYFAQIPSSLSATAFEEDPTQAAFTWAQAQGFEDNKYTLVGLSYQRALSSRLHNTTSIFYSYLDHYEARPFNILDEYTNGYGLRSIFNYGFDFLSESADLNVGVEVYADRYNWSAFENLYRENDGNGSLQGDRISQNKEFRNQTFLFSTVELPINERLKAQAGLNLNWTRYDYRDLFNTGEDNKSAERDFSPVLLPNLMLQYRFPGRGLIFGNISRGFSNPSLEETLTPDGLINPDIKQETGLSYELGTQLRLFASKLWFSIAVYRMDIENLLVADRVGEDQFIGRNAGSTRHQGLELDMDYTLNLGKDLKISPFLSYTLNDHSFVEFMDGDEDFSGNPLTGVPRHRVNAGLRLLKSNVFYWNTTYQYVDEIPLTDSAELFSDAYGILNTRLGFTATLTPSLLLGIDAGVNNIFDEVYAQSVLINARGFGGAEPRYFYPGNERNFYTGLRLSLAL